MGESQPSFEERPIQQRKALCSMSFGDTAHWRKCRTTVMVATVCMGWIEFMLLSIVMQRYWLAGSDSPI